MGVPILQGPMKSYTWMSFKITAFRRTERPSLPSVIWPVLDSFQWQHLRRKGYLSRCVWLLPIFTQAITGMISALETSTRHGKVSDKLLHLTAPSFQKEWALPCVECQCPPDLAAFWQELLPLQGPLQAPYLEVFKTVQVLTWDCEFLSVWLSRDKLPSMFDIKVVIIYLWFLSFSF